MNKYIVAHFNATEGKLTQKPVLANSILEATQKYARSIGKTIGDNEHPNSVCYNDWFTAIKVGNINPTPRPLYYKF